jgi:inhibitor of KinA sporulation pathway (predicted exonuclease)
MTFAKSRVPNKDEVSAFTRDPILNYFKYVVIRRLQHKTGLQTQQQGPKRKQLLQLLQWLKKHRQMTIITILLLKMVQVVTFTHLLVLDFEAQCRDRPEPAPQPQEIIEFPIVVVEVATGNVVDEYHTYVRPTAHPKLYPFCTQLTGITQAQVDSGVTIDEALDRAADFAAKYDEYPNRACIVTCGHWDLRTALRNECRAKQITIPRLFRRWINVKVVFQEYVNTTQVVVESQALDTAARHGGHAGPFRHRSGWPSSLGHRRCAQYCTNCSSIVEEKRGI